MTLWEFVTRRWDLVVERAGQHVVLVATAMGIAVVTGVGLGIACTYSPRLASIALAAASVVMTIPSLAMFAFMIPVMGLGFAPAVAGLVMYTQLPILRNTYTGLRGVDPAILDAARGMGMSEWRILVRIKLPLALPVLLGGLRTAVVMGVGLGTIAAYVGSGGLGELIFRGISRSNANMVLTGAIAVAAMATLVDLPLSISRRRRPSTRRDTPERGDAVDPARARHQAVPGQ